MFYNLRFLKFARRTGILLMEAGLFLTKGESGIMKSLVVFAACLAVLLFSGCFFESYRPVGEFDLTLEKAEKTGRALRMLEFRNDSTAGSRMQSRDASGRVIRDPYHRWALPPEQLVARALNLALRPDSESAVPVPVAGTLEVFEVDSARKEFRLAGSWSLPDDRREFRFDFSVPVEEDSAEAVARAAGVAVGRLADRLALWSRTELGDVR